MPAAAWRAGRARTCRGWGRAGAAVGGPGYARTRRCRRRQLGPTQSGEVQSFNWRAGCRPGHPCPNALNRPDLTRTGPGRPADHPMRMLDCALEMSGGTMSLLELQPLQCTITNPNIDTCSKASADSPDQVSALCQHLSRQNDVFAGFAVVVDGTPESASFHIRCMQARLTLRKKRGSVLACITARPHFTVTRPQPSNTVRPDTVGPSSAAA
jgi:hypothetical protein